MALIMRGARLANVPVELVLERAGIRLEELEPATAARLPIDQMRRAFSALDELAQEPLLGLAMATRLEPGGFDLLDYLVQNAQTLRDACQRFCRYLPLLANAGRVWLSESGDRAVLCHHAQGALPFLSQLLIGGIVSRAVALTGSRLRPASVGFMHCARAPEQDYARLLGGATVSFGQPFDHVAFARSDLDLPISRSDARLSRILERQAEDVVARITPVPRASDDAVREAARELVLSGHASLERLAERLGTTPRTLQRRLAEAGLSHRSLMDSVRAELVESALARGHGNMSALARTLGYATAGSLKRARERWRHESH